MTRVAWANVLLVMDAQIGTCRKIINNNIKSRPNKANRHQEEIFASRAAVLIQKNARPIALKIT